MERGRKDVRRHTVLAMEISKWNKIMDSFISLVGYDSGIQEVVDIKRDLYGDKSIYELNFKEDRKLIYRLRRLYEHLDSKKEYSESTKERREVMPLRCL